MDRFCKLVYLAGIIAQTAIRLPYERQRQKQRVAVDHVTRRERTIVGLLFIGSAVLPLLYICTPWLNRFNYRWSSATKKRAAGVGVVFMGAALWLFRRSHIDLGRNWSWSLELRDEHTLVTNGVYRAIRHPMYASQWLWVVGQLLLLQNRIAGPAGLLVFAPFYALRVSAEERLMLDQFGDTYRRYMQRTGRVLPRFSSLHKNTES